MLATIARLGGVLAVEEGADPSEAPNPILPATAELIWAIIAFAILFLLMYKFAFPAVRKAMDARSSRIRNDLDDAERTRTEAQTILEDYRRQLADARNESNRIIEESRQQAESVRRDMIARAELEAAEIRRRNEEEIGAARARATADLRAQVSQLSLELAEKVVQRNLDRDTNIALIERYIDEVGARQRA